MLYTIIDIADMKFSTDPDDVLVTYSLGSCIGVTLYDSTVKVGGMIHIMLPLSKIDPDKAVTKPHMFADTGMTNFLEVLYKKGATSKNLIAMIAGGASLLDKQKFFNIGERNYTVVKKILEKNHIKIIGEDVGGNVSRTVFLYMADGETVIRTSGKESGL